MEHYSSLRRLQAEEKIGRTCPMAVMRRQTATFPLHWHNYFEIEIILSGEGRHFFNGIFYNIGKGDVYILTPTDFHAVEVLSPIELINISFEEACLVEENLAFLLAPDAVKQKKLDGEEFERIVMGSELLRNECESNGACKQQLLEYILSRLLRNSKEQHQESVNREYLRGIWKAAAYMELHFREKISLEQLSKLSGYSPTYFSELFRKITGQSYIDRLKMLRLRYAAVLLSNGLSVSDACYGSGFGSLSNFQASFKVEYGISPGAYRKAQKS